MSAATSNYTNFGPCVNKINGSVAREFDTCNSITHSVIAAPTV